MQLPGRLRGLMLAGGTVCSVVGLTVVWKDWVGGDTYKPKVEADLKDKVVLITGANTGIGRATALDLARKKAKVYMLCRDGVKCEETRQEIVLETKNKYVYCRECDLSSQKSIRDFVDKFRQKESKVDVLINNAGVMNLPRQLSEDGVEMHLAVNHLGHFLLTLLLRDWLAKAAPSRVIYLMNLDYRKGEINFDDLNCSQTYNRTTAFNRSQLANMLLVTTELATTFKKLGVTVNAVYPGVVSTNIKRHMGVDKSIVGNVISNPLLWFFNKSPQQGSQTVIFLATDESVSNVTGKLYSNLKEHEIDAKGTDSALAKRLVATDRYWTGLVASKEESVRQ